MGQGRNNIHLLTQGVNPRALRQLSELHREFYKSLTAIVQDEMNWGDVPFFSLGCMDTFLEELQEEKS